MHLIDKLLNIDIDEQIVRQIYFILRYINNKNIDIYININTQIKMDN